MHHIQQYILKILTTQQYARFSELKPPRVESNTFSYHLRCLLRDKYILKDEYGYSLAAEGLRFVDRISLDEFKPRLQPKIITIVQVKNKAGKVLYITRKKQPFIGQLTWPNGKLHMDGEQIADAARRELREKTGLDIDADQLIHRGEGYIHAYQGEVLISSVLCHVFSAEFDRCSGELLSGQWIGEDEVDGQRLAPGVTTLRRYICESGQERFFFEVNSRR